MFMRCLLRKEARNTCKTVIEVLISLRWQPFLSPLSTIHHGWVHAAANERTRALSKIRWSQQHNHGMADNTLKVDE